MVEKLHPQVHGEPCRWLDEELVSVGGYIPETKLTHPLCAECDGVEGVDINSSKRLVYNKGLGLGGRQSTEDYGEVDYEEYKVDKVAFARQD